MQSERERERELTGGDRVRDQKQKLVSESWVVLAPIQMQLVGFRWMLTMTAVLALARVLRVR